MAAPPTQSDAAAMAALPPGTQFILHVHELNPGNGDHTLHDLLFVMPFTVEKIFDRLRLLLRHFNEALGTRKKGRLAR